MGEDRMLEALFCIFCIYFRFHVFDEMSHLLPSRTITQVLYPSRKHRRDERPERIGNRRGKTFNFWDKTVLFVTNLLLYTSIIWSIANWL